MRKRILFGVKHLGKFIPPPFFKVQLNNFLLAFQPVSRHLNPQSKLWFYWSNDPPPSKALQWTERDLKGCCRGGLKKKTLISFKGHKIMMRDWCKWNNNEKATDHSFPDLLCHDADPPRRKKCKMFLALVLVFPIDEAYLRFTLLL